MNLSPNAPPPTPANPNQALALVRQLPDQQLIQVVQQSGQNPAVQLAAMQELQNRKRLRDAQQAQVAQQQQQTQAVQQAQSQQAAQGTQQTLARQQADRLAGGIGQLPAPNMAQMATGGLVPSDEHPKHMDGGGPVAFQVGGDTASGWAEWRQANDPNWLHASNLTFPTPTQRTPSVTPGNFWGMFNEANEDPYIVQQTAAAEQRQRALGVPISAETPAPHGSQYKSDSYYTSSVPMPKGYKAPTERTLPEEENKGAPQEQQQDQSMSPDYMFGLLQRYGQDRFGTPSPASDTITHAQQVAENARKNSSGLAWLRAAAGMLGNTSPFASVAIGKGVEGLAQGLQEGQQLHQQALEKIAGLQQEQYRTKMQYAGQVDATRMHMFGLNLLQYQTRMMGLDQNAQNQVLNQYDTMVKQEMEDDPLLKPTSAMYMQAGTGTNPAALAVIDGRRREARNRAWARVQQMLGNIRQMGVHAGQLYGSNPQAGAPQQTPGHFATLPPGGQIVGQ